MHHVYNQSLSLHLDLMHVSPLAKGPVTSCRACGPLVTAGEAFTNPPGVADKVWEA